MDVDDGLAVLAGGASGHVLSDTAHLNKSSVYQTV